MNQALHVIETLARRERVAVIAALTAASVMAWIYILAGANMEMAMPGMEASRTGIGYLLLIFPMWWFMMVAMMLPSAAPMILLFMAISQKQHERESPAAASVLFTLGYLIAWGVFSAGAALAQWALGEAGMLQPALHIAGPYLGAALLSGAGLWQLTPVKHACLQYCRSPVRYLSTHWRAGAAGALRMGMQHGVFCLGCCWLLMGLLFVGGVMNLYWITGIAAYVLLEKLLPRTQALTRASGVVLVAAGLWQGFAAL